MQSVPSPTLPGSFLGAASRRSNANPLRSAPRWWADARRPGAAVTGSRPDRVRRQLPHQPRCRCDASRPADADQPPLCRRRGPQSPLSVPPCSASSTTCYPPSCKREPATCSSPTRRACIVGWSEPRVPLECHLGEGMPHGGFVGGTPEDDDLAQAIRVLIEARWQQPPDPGRPRLEHKRKSGPSARFVRVPRRSITALGCARRPGADNWRRSRRSSNRSAARAVRA